MLFVSKQEFPQTSSEYKIYCGLTVVKLKMYKNSNYFLFHFCSNSRLFLDGGILGEIKGVRFSEVWISGDFGGHHT
jgi:hypothetical protein